MTVGSEVVTETGGRPAGRPRDPEVDAALLSATRSVLVEVGFERLSLDLVAARARTTRSAIYRRWRNKTELVVAAIELELGSPTLPDTGDLREDLLAAARSYEHAEPEAHRLLAALLAELLRNPELKAVAQRVLGDPYESLFSQILIRAQGRGLVAVELDVTTIAAIFPLFAFQRVAVEGRPVDDDLVHRVIDGCVLPLL